MSWKCRGKLRHPRTLEEGAQPAEETHRNHTPQPPGPYLQQIEGLAGQLVAAEAGVPAHYMGLRADQAASADAIRAMEARLVKRAERRQKSFGRAWVEVGRLARALSSEVDVWSVEGSQIRWGNPATPTIAATTDAVVKMTQANIIPATSTVAWDMLGMTPEQKRLMRTEVAQQRVSDVAAAAGNAQVIQTTPVESGLDTFLQGSDSSGI